MSALFHWLVQTTWQASILILLVGVVCRIFRRRLPASWRYALWLLVVARLLVPEISLPAHRASLYAVVPEMPALSMEPAIKAEGSEPVQAATVVSEKIPDNPPQRPGIDVPDGQSSLVAIWIIGIVAGIAIHACRHVAFRRHLHRSTAPAPPAIRTLVDRCRRALRLRRSVPVLVTNAVATPAVAGLLRPSILLPETVVQSFDRRQLRLVILHELAHLRRHDSVTALAAGLAHLTHWFNPLVWWAMARMSADRELAVDAFVLRATDRGADYGKTLLRLAAEPAAHAFTRPALGITEGSRSLRRRIVEIATHRPARLAGSVLGALLIVGIAIVALSRKPPAPPSNRFVETEAARSFDEAVVEGRMESIELLVQMNSGVPSGVLTNVANFGSPEVIRKLVELGANPNEQNNSDGSTPLMHAAFAGKLEVARTLVELGADVNRLADDGSNAARWATSFAGAQDVLQYLIDQGIRLDIYDKWGNTLLIEMMNYVPRRRKLKNDRPVSPQEIEDAEARERQKIDILARAGVDLNQPAAPGTYLAMGTPLMEALNGGQYNYARALLDHHVDIFAKDRWGNSALSCLLGGFCWGQPYPVDIAKRLLDAGADPDCTYLYPNSDPPPKPFAGIAALLRQAAVAQDDPARVESARQTLGLLLDHGAKFPGFLPAKDMEMLNTVARNNLPKLQAAIASGARIDAADDAGWTSLKLSLALDESDILQWLLANGASMKSAPDDENSPLWLAVSQNDVGLVRRFLAAGAKPTPGVAAMAAQRRNLEILQILFAAGADAKDVHLVGSIRDGDIEIIRALLDHGTDAEGTNFENRRNLFWAAYYNQPAILKLLLERGADPTVVTMYHETPLSEAKGRGFTECAAILEKAIAARNEAQ